MPNFPSRSLKLFEELGRERMAKVGHLTATEFEIACWRLAQIAASYPDQASIVLLEKLEGNDNDAFPPISEHRWRKTTNFSWQSFLNLLKQELESRLAIISDECSERTQSAFTMCALFIDLIYSHAICTQWPSTADPVLSCSALTLSSARLNLKPVYSSFLKALRNSKRLSETDLAEDRFEDFIRTFVDFVLLSLFSDITTSGTIDYGHLKHTRQNFFLIWGKKWFDTTKCESEYIRVSDFYLENDVNEYLAWKVLSESVKQGKFQKWFSDLCGKHFKIKNIENLAWIKEGIERISLPWIIPSSLLDFFPIFREIDSQKAIAESDLFKNFTFKYEQSGKLIATRNRDLLPEDKKFIFLDQLAVHLPKTENKWSVEIIARLKNKKYTAKKFNSDASKVKGDQREDILDGLKCNVQDFSLGNSL